MVEYLPLNIGMEANDGVTSEKNIKALIISAWAAQTRETLRIDLWTKDMPLDDMKQFYHQTLLSMANSFERATNDTKMSATMRDFCDYFAEKMKLKQNKMRPKIVFL